MGHPITAPTRRSTCTIRMAMGSSWPGTVTRHRGATVGKSSSTARCSIGRVYWPSSTTRPRPRFWPGWHATHKEERGTRNEDQRVDGTVGLAVGDCPAADCGRDHLRDAWAAEALRDG